jgi:indole-3-glycerol phosphate synthase
MPAYLDDILTAHRQMAGGDRRNPGGLRRQADEAGPPDRDFRAALEAVGTGQMAVIAEVKRRSPSRGVLVADLDPAAVAVEYQAGGAACLSVLTDRHFFGGSPDDLEAARLATDLPVLRKDFTVSANDVCDALLMGADAVLLIVAALADDELGGLVRLAADIGLAALVEVHDAAELDRALAAGATIVGVNQRDLRTFEVDPGLAAALAPRVPDDVVLVAESGIGGAEDVAPLAEAGYRAVLVGESIVTASDRAAAVAALVAAVPMTGSPS